LMPGRARREKDGAAAIILLSRQLERMV
jgi:hypothetical protein